MGQNERLPMQEAAGQVHNQAELPVHGTVANPVEEEIVYQPLLTSTNLLQE